MKKLILLAVLYCGVSCTNPEDSVNNHTDSAKDANTEGKTPNNYPGPTQTGNEASTGMDTSHVPTTSANGTGTSTSGAAGSGNDTSKGKKQ